MDVTRDTEVKVRLTKAEKDNIARAAEASGLNPAAFIRYWALIGASLPPGTPFITVPSAAHTALKRPGPREFK